MQTMSDQIYAEQYQKIKAAILELENGDSDQASNLVQGLISGFSDGLAQPEDIQTLFFVDALRKRLQPHAHEVGNLYLIPDDDGQQIKLFNFMAEKFPLVKFAQHLVNTAAVEEIQGEENVVILDIGIGTGQQVVKLLGLAFQQKVALKHITVIGIEPAAQSLSMAQSALKELAEKNQVELRFEAIQKAAEDLNGQDWLNLEEMITAAHGKLIVNASFALHHIRPVSLRSKLFERLQQFSPALLALIEPYADFLTLDFPERFTNAWHHYGLVFRAIDEIEGSLEEKNKIKKLFFSREIEDVLSDDRHRIEQFETGEMWLELIQNAGFQSRRIECSEPTLPNFPFVTVRKMPNYITLNVEGYPILSIITAR